MFKRGMPVDIANAVAEYIGADSTSKWIARYDTLGSLCWKLNERAFRDLSTVCSYKPMIYKNYRKDPSVVMINGTNQYSDIDTVVISPQLINHSKSRMTIYTGYEISPNVFNYISLLCEWSFGETGDGVPNSFELRSTEFPRTPFAQRPVFFTTCLNGKLYCPNETKWNREHQITHAHIGNHCIVVEHDEVLLQYEWNDALNIGEYVVFNNAPADPYPIWVHDTEADNVGWVH